MASTKQGAVAKVERAQPSYLELIQMAIEHQAGVGELRGLFELQRDYEAEQARKAFNHAMNAFQAECPPIPRSRKAAKSAYAPLEDIERIIRPIREKCGLWVAYKMAPMHPGDTVLFGWAIVSHVQGHKEEMGHQGLSLLEPIMGRSGGTAMNRTQADAGTITYLKRYILAAALNLTYEGEDTDGTLVDGPVTAEQLQDLATLIPQSKYGLKQWLAVAVEKLEDLSEHQAKRLLARLRVQG